MRKFLACFSFLMLFAFAGRLQAQQTFVINGSSYAFPDVDDQDWGQNVTDWASAVSNGMFQKAGGTFALTAEVYFGTNGVKVSYIRTSVGAAPSAGLLRAGATDFIAWRSTDNTRNYQLGMSTGHQLTWDGQTLSTTPLNSSALDTSGSTQTKAGGLTVGGTLTAQAFSGNGSALNSLSTSTLANAADVAGSTATLTTRLNTTDSFVAGTTNYIPQVQKSTGVVIQDDGVHKGTATAINFGSNLSVTFTGSTANITATSSGGGGSSIKTVSVVIATSADSGADLSGTDQSVFNTAIAAIGTNNGEIRVRPGVYTPTAIVNSAHSGIIITCENGAIFENSGNFDMFHISGTIRGCEFHALSSYTGSFIVIGGSKAVATRNVVSNGSAGNGNTGLIQGGIGSGMEISYNVFDGNVIGDGGRALIHLNSSTGTLVDHNTMRYNSASGNNLITLVNSNKSRITWNYVLDTLSERMIVPRTTASNQTYIANNTYITEGAGAANGNTFYTREVVCTTTTILNNYIQLGPLADGAMDVDGPSNVSGNTIAGHATVAITAASGASSTGNFIHGNTCISGNATCITDSATTTILRDNRKSDSTTTTDTP